MLIDIDASLLTPTSAVGRIYGELELAHLPRIGETVSLPLVASAKCGFSDHLVVEHVIHAVGASAKPMLSLSPSSHLLRMNRPFTLFLGLAVVVVFFGDRFLSADNYKVAFAAIAVVFLGFWLYGAMHMPATISEQLNKSHHPDEDVRALQDGEISISQYAERKAAKQSGSTNAADTQCREHENQRSSP